MFKSKTIVDIIYNLQEMIGDGVFLKYRENNVFTSITYAKFLQMMEKLAASLYEIGIRKGDKIGIISDNLYKWLISDMAILSLGAIDVPRGSDSLAGEIAYILKHSDSKVCFVENPEQADKVISIHNEVPQIKLIILLTGEISSVSEKIPPDIKMHHFDQLLKDGESLLKRHKEAIAVLKNSINENDLATIIYTSGTTGDPKGVMLLHKNIMHNVHSLPVVLSIKVTDRWLSVLPVWHAFERTVEYCLMSCGAMMAYSKPTAKHLLPDLEEIKPTFMVSVPRIWEALYNGIMLRLKSVSPVQKAIFRFFIKIGLIYSKAWKTMSGMEALFKKPSLFHIIGKKILAFLKLFFLFFLDKLGDVLVFSKIRKKTGGCLKGPISGGGKLPFFVDDFFAAIKINILEGWGLTETSPVVGVRDFKTLISGTVGKASPGVQIMIGDNNWNPLPDQHKKGMVYIKGDLVMAGYYKEPDKTALIIKDGWLKTGDLGRLTINSVLQLLGRAKDTIVLIGGENIEPSPIEDMLLENSLISQVIIVGQDKKNLGGLIVPEKDNIIDFAIENNIKYDEYEELLKEEKVISLFDKIIKEKISTKNQFKAFEKVTCFALLQTPFEVGKELTYTLKMKRNVIMGKYHDVIEEMYVKN